MDKRTDRQESGFDETNGLAPGLNGDADDPSRGDDQDDEGHGVLGDVIEDVTTGFHDRDEDGDDRE